MFVRSIFLIALSSLLANASPLDKRQTVQGIQNALGLSNDPSAFSQVISGTRTYYFPSIQADNHLITIQISSNLNNVLADPANNHTIFTTQDRPNDTGFFKYDTNNYLITYALNPPKPAKSYLRVLQNTGTDLTKGWSDIGQIVNASGSVLTNVYDSQAFLHPNKNRYLLYAYAGNSVFIAQMTSPTTIANPTLIHGSSSTTVEAPGVLIQGNTVNIFWSENGYTTPAYNVRRISVPTGADPTNSATWKGLNATTILEASSTNGVYGPGSASTFTGPDGNPWLAYDCFYTAGGLSGPRRGQVQPVQFNGEVMAAMVPLKPSRFVNSTTS